MSRRRVIVGLVGLALVAVVAVVFWPRSPRPCRATFELVREGMTYGEVCATVGGPAGHYADWSVPPRLREMGTARWVANDAELAVSWDPYGVIYEVSISDPPPDPRPPLERIRACFRR